ncbi:MAG: hypothetical protein U0401_06030 [Anaerolineae bacterium]
MDVAYCKGLTPTCGGDDAGGENLGFGQVEVVQQRVFRQDGLGTGCGLAEHVKRAGNRIRRRDEQ